MRRIYALPLGREVFYPPSADNGLIGYTCSYIRFCSFSILPQQVGLVAETGAEVFAVLQTNLEEEVP